MTIIRAEVYKKKPSISYSESTYNNSLVFGCIKAVMVLMNNSLAAPYFIPGEEELESMTSQLSKMGKKVDHRRCGEITI